MRKMRILQAKMTVVSGTAVINFDWTRAALQAAGIPVPRGVEPFAMFWPSPSGDITCKGLALRAIDTDEKIFRLCPTVGTAKPLGDFNSLIGPEAGGFWSPWWAADSGLRLMAELTNSGADQDGNYHNHVTEAWPYIIGCFAGTASRDAGAETTSVSRAGGPARRGPPPPDQPPSALQLETAAKKLAEGCL